MGKSWSKRVRDGVYSLVLKRVPRHCLKEEIARRQIEKAAAIYGPFVNGLELADEAVLNASGESGRVSGELVEAIRTLAKPTDVLLLPGERNSAKSVYGKISRIPECNIVTAGLHDEMDFSWDYEEAPPAAMPRVDLIASHAMIEHLINPYRHLVDCYGLLNVGGNMVFHTVLPGFQYHRYPVDCLRFFPDWFEEIAKRLGATISFKSTSASGSIVYAMTKTGPKG